MKDLMNSPEINLRTAVFDDIPKIVEMYRGTVHAVNAKDYTPEQIKVWADGPVNYPRWEKAIEEQYFVLAEIDNTPLPSAQTVGLTDSLPSQEGNIFLAGFSSIAKDGYLDFMYVSKDFQRCGVASKLLAAIEQKAKEQNNPEIYSHVSKTAKGFFLKTGYEHREDIKDMYKGELFINALMVKKL
ncbi:MAG TPA: GNAT family N-acetyltransferase [Ignavibacteria bacterium]|nr:GNAT family N-acetyltransferase [Ignavibacteria bacterium]HRF66279.1 GNAT family N-acetyltransferase [Ignavibacteria bacterium]HRJ05080.1 GNAT family N-acetyltransferase [Ignavibacteria bacterium]